MGQNRVVSRAGSNVVQIDVGSDEAPGANHDAAKHIPPQHQPVVAASTVNRVHPAAQAEPEPEPQGEMSDNFVAGGPAGRPAPAVGDNTAPDEQRNFEDTGRCTLLPTPLTSGARRPLQML